MVNVNLKKPLAPAVIITVALLALNYLMSFIGYPVAPLYSVQPVSAVTETIGAAAVGQVTQVGVIDKFLAWIGGIIPVGDYLGMGVVLSFISAYLILLVGMFLVDNLKLPSAKGRVGRVASLVLWGSAVFYVLIVGLVGQAWGVWAGLAIHTLILAFVTAWIADMMKIKI